MFLELVKETVNGVKQKMYCADEKCHKSCIFVSHVNNRNKHFCEEDFELIKEMAYMHGFNGITWKDKE